MNTIFGRLLAIPFVAGLIIAGCGDNPVEGEKNHDHFEPRGLILRVGTDSVVYDNGVVNGSLTVKAGEETDLISLDFILEDGERETPTDDDFSLDYTIGDTTVASVEQHEADGPWKFHIDGRKAGTTTLTLQLMHVDHADFTAKPIEVVVTP